jgi:hypothetical protein
MVKHVERTLASRVRRQPEHSYPARVATGAENPPESTVAEFARIQKFANLNSCEFSYAMRKVCRATS